jgi:hypothetical protein
MDKAISWTFASLIRRFGRVDEVSFSVLSHGGARTSHRRGSSIGAFA